MRADSYDGYECLSKRDDSSLFMASCNKNCPVECQKGITYNCNGECIPFRLPCENVCRPGKFEFKKCTVTKVHVCLEVLSSTLQCPVVPGSYLDRLVANPILLDEVGEAQPGIFLNERHRR